MDLPFARNSLLNVHCPEKRVAGRRETVDFVEKLPLLRAVLRNGLNKRSLTTRGGKRKVHRMKVLLPSIADGRGG